MEYVLARVKLQIGTLDPDRPKVNPCLPMYLSEGRASNVMCVHGTDYFGWSGAQDDHGVRTHNGHGKLSRKF